MTNAEDGEDLTAEELQQIEREVTALQAQLDRALNRLLEMHDDCEDDALHFLTQDFRRIAQQRREENRTAAALSAVAANQH